MKARLKCVGILAVLLASSPTSAPGQNIQLSPAEKCRFVMTADLADAKAPRFDEYPTATERFVPASKLNFDSDPIATTYRTILRREMIKRPNYAGHYRVVFRGCGTSCAIFAVIDLRTGSVITAKEFGFVSGANLLADDFLPGALTDGWGFRFKRGSSLLVVLGAPDENESKTGAYCFVLRGEGLSLVHTTIPRKDCEDAGP